MLQSALLCPDTVNSGQRLESQDVLYRSTLSIPFRQILANLSHSGFRCKESGKYSEKKRSVGLKMPWKESNWIFFGSRLRAGSDGIYSRHTYDRHGVTTGLQT